MVAVPAQYVALLKKAAADSGLPYSVVAAQVFVESSFMPGAVSPTGAEGLFEFEPGAWATYGTGPASNRMNPTIEGEAYAKMMKALLQQEGGSVQKALAAYNAGSGNIGAGMGYADKILGLAGEPVTITGSTPTSGGTSTPSAPGGQIVSQHSTKSGESTSIWGDIWDGLKTIGGDVTAPASAIVGVAEGIGGFAQDFSRLLKMIDWLFEPSSWVRIVAGIVGVTLLGLAAVMLWKAAGGSAPKPKGGGGGMPMIVPVPV
jgi:hypothetical protein